MVLKEVSMCESHFIYQEEVCKSVKTKATLTERRTFFQLLEQMSRKKCLQTEMCFLKVIPGNKETKCSLQNIKLS
jgi:hypothetical protein